MQMLRSGLRGAIANMRTNLTGIKDPNVRIRYEDMIASWEQTLRGN
jgi:formiminotetrahydrofolate cyclodeaminase